jgi:hypothetical protein
MSHQLTEWYSVEKAARSAGQYNLADTIHELLSTLMHERHEYYVYVCDVAGLAPYGSPHFPDGWVE